MPWPQGSARSSSRRGRSWSRPPAPDPARRRGGARQRDARRLRRAGPALGDGAHAALERDVGADVLARWHSRTGRPVVSLVVVHALTATAAVADARQVDLLAGAWQVLGMPWLPAATVGTVLLLVVAGMSVRASRQRISHERWHGVHLLDLRRRRARLRPPAGRARPRGTPLAAGPVGARLLPRLRTRAHPSRPDPAAPGGAAPDARPRGPTRRPRCRLHRRRGPAPRGAASRVGAVLPLALPHPGPLGDGAPVQPVLGARSRPAPAHGEGAR